MKRITCSLCGGTGVAYDVPETLETPQTKKLPALEKQMRLPLVSTDEEEEAWKVLEKNLKQA